jgi:murein DD-endopeptidase MepM/ murein hydrolase activator NlpD
MVRAVPSGAIRRRRGPPEEAAVPPPAQRRAAVAALAVALALAPVASAPAGAPPGAAASATARPVEVAPATAAAGVTAPTVPPPATRRIPALRLPVHGMLVRGFEAPAGPYGPGHRGVDLRAPMGTTVAAPAAGTVGFAGPVAGSVWVSLLVAPGVVVTVGPLLAPAVAAGERVATLAPVGGLAAGHGGAVHLSLRVDGAYLDPLPWLVDRPRARLAPLPAATA